MTRVGVAISTTGDEHRLGFLETTVREWDRCLPDGASLFVTVDGDTDAAERAASVVAQYTGSVYRVGPKMTFTGGARQGVAVSKNTGLELLMDVGWPGNRIEHLFLSDDDAYPLSPHSLGRHTTLADALPHSMVCWGKHRLLEPKAGAAYAKWTWPRGVVLYQTRAVVEKVGGMLEAFGPGGHEHAEYSRRIYQHGLTPAPYCTPLVYAMDSVTGKACRADRSWHCEDMRKQGETSVELGHRRKAITSLRKGQRDWERIEEIMTGMDGHTHFVPFRAHQNHRGSVTLIPTSTSRGAGGDL